MKKLIFSLVFVLMVPVGAFAIELKTSAQDLFPKFYVDSSGRMTGINIDIMKAIEKEVPNLKFAGKESDKINFAPWKRTQAWLESGEIDIVFGMSKSKKRLKRGFVFIDTPLYTVKNILAVRSDDNIQINSFGDIEKLGKKGTILVMPGTATYRFLQSQKHKLFIDYSGRIISQNLKKLVKGRGRFFFSHDLGILSTIKVEGYMGKIKTLPNVFRTYYHNAAFSSKVPRNTVEKVGKALKKLEQNGTLKKIYKKYTN